MIVPTVLPPKDPRLSNSHMSFEELDHFVIRQLQLGNSGAIAYRNMPHTIADKQRNINALVTCACGHPNRVGPDYFGSAAAARKLVFIF